MPKSRPGARPVTRAGLLTALTAANACTSPMDLTPDLVAAALPRIAPGLAKYRSLQAALRRTDVSTDRDFQRAFNGFYRVRRDESWQRVFFGLLEREKRAPRGFEPVLRDLHRDLRRFEASFASKLVATVDPSLPVIDAFVLQNLDLRLPSASQPDRLRGIIDIYRRVREKYAGALASGEGRLAVAAFDAAYPESGLHDVKKLDLILWQTRSDEPEHDARPRGGSGMSRYDPLEDWLAAQGGRPVTMTFKQIAQIIGSDLPRSAWIYQAWWANEVEPKTHVQKRAWMAAGYRVGHVDQRGGIVRFVPR